MRPILFLAVGLLVGVAGAVLFVQSMPPKEGSAEERAAKLEVELKSANNRVAALEAADPHGRRRPGRTLADGARSIAEDLRDGKPVTPDDIFRATQPLLRDLSPLFNRMRIRDEQRKVDAMSGEIARKYGLNPTQQESLKKWFDQKAVEDADRFDKLVTQEGVRMQDVMEASRDVRPGEGLDRFMESTLQGDKLAAFKSDRMLEKVASVQREADMNVTRLNSMVNLDETQKGQVFGVMARATKDFDPAMQFEGLGTDTAPLASGKSKQDAILSVLRPEQRQAYEQEKQRRRDAEEKDLQSIGLSLPANWDPLENDKFR